MKKTNPWITISCIILSTIYIFNVLRIFKLMDNQAYQAEVGFYNENKNSLDAVYIGGSNVYRFWEPPLAWGDYGIAVWNYSMSQLNAKPLPYLIKEIHKTQPETLFIISLNAFKILDVNDVHIHRDTNYLNFSVNKIEMIYSLANEIGYKGLDQLEFYFPIIRFHSRWSELNTWDFTRKIDGLKGGHVDNRFLKTSIPVTEQYDIIYEEAKLTAEQSALLEEFLEFLDDSGHKVLFVSSPQALGEDIKTYKHINRMATIIQEHGYPCLNLINAIDETGIQPETDFYDNNHTNVHGAIKFTDYLAQYLVDNYGFTDKRGQPGWESWDESVGLITDLIAPYTLEFEREHASRDYELETPVLNKVKVKEQTITLSWKESPNAEGYDIYRKSAASGEQNWTYLISTESDTLQYFDSDLNPKTNYTYTVVPKIKTDGIERYGNFNFTGVSGTTK